MIYNEFNKSIHFDFKADLKNPMHLNPRMKKKNPDLGNELKRAASEYGWKVEKDGNDYWLFNRNNKKLVRIVKGEKNYKIYDSYGTKLLGGNNSIVDGAKRVMTEYFYASTINPRMSANDKRLAVSRGMHKAKAERMRKAFSQQTEVKTFSMNVQLPKAGDKVVYIGDATDITYRSDKFDGKMRDYIHELKKFGKILAVVPKGSDKVSTIIIADLNLRIKPEGLTG